MSIMEIGLCTSPGLLWTTSEFVHGTTCAYMTITGDTFFSVSCICSSVKTFLPETYCKTLGIAGDVEKVSLKN